MHLLRLLSIFALPALLLGITLGAAIGQEAPLHLTDSADGQTLPPEAQRRVLHLVIRSMYDEVDDATGAALDEELRALTREETRLFLGFSFAIQKIGFSGDSWANGGPVVPLPRQRYVLSLIERALYDDATSDQLQAEIAALSEAEHNLYLRLSDAIQHLGAGDDTAYLSAELVKIRDVILYLMEQEGVSSFMDINLSEDELKAKLRNVLPEQPPSLAPDACYWPYVSCTYIPFTTQSWRGYCSHGYCYTGSGHDRVTEDPGGCELFGCDYRVWFYTPWPWYGIDGTNREGNCVADRGPHAARWASSRTEMEFGFGTVTFQCGIIDGNWLATIMRVQPY